ncbi:unnamed protein product [Caenorhabditis brenneri]
MDIPEFPFMGILVILLLILACVTMFLHWKLIKVAVMRDFFMTFARSLLGIISGGYVCTTFTNFSIGISSALGMESVKIGFENINATLEFIMNFAKLFFFLDSYIGSYKELFGYKPIGSFIYIWICMTTFFVALVIPEFSARGFNGNPPSHYISFGFTVINLLLNTYVFFSKRADMENNLGKVPLNTRFRTEEAKETTKVMLIVTVFRFCVSGSWALFFFLDNNFLLMPPCAHAIANALFLAFRSGEAIVFAASFIFFHRSIARYNEREAIKEKYPDGLPEEATEDEKLLFMAPEETSEENMEKQTNKWNKAFRKHNKVNKKSQPNPTIYKSTHLRIPSFESLD